MSKSLILLIAIFSLWVFISFTKTVENKNGKGKNNFNFADDDIKRVNAGNFLINEVVIV